MKSAVPPPVGVALEIAAGAATPAELAPAEVSAAAIVVPPGARIVVEAGVAVRVA